MPISLTATAASSVSELECGKITSLPVHNLLHEHPQGKQYGPRAGSCLLSWSHRSIPEASPRGSDSGRRELSARSDPHTARSSGSAWALPPTQGCPNFPIPGGLPVLRPHNILHFSFSSSLVSNDHHLATCLTPKSFPNCEGHDGNPHFSGPGARLADTRAAFHWPLLIRTAVLSVLAPSWTPSSSRSVCVPRPVDNPTNSCVLGK